MDYLYLKASHLDAFLKPVINSTNLVAQKIFFVESLIVCSDT